MEITDEILAQKKVSGYPVKALKRITNNGEIVYILRGEGPGGYIHEAMFPSLRKLIKAYNRASA